MAEHSIMSFTGETAYLSNYFEIPVKFDGVQYGSSEAAYQAQKCVLGYEKAMFAELNPDQAKKKSRDILMRPDWDIIREEIMYRVVKAKFSQNEEIREKLIATGDAYLAEGNYWNDLFWGVSDKTGYGYNRLGHILMRVREELAESEVERI